MLRAPDNDGPGVYVTRAELIAQRGTPDAHRGLRLPASGSSAGEHRSRARGPGIELDEIRAYQSGDDIRNIDWRASARLGRPFTRLFSEERERSLFVAIDQRVSMFFGTRRLFKSVLAARLAAIEIWAALERGERIGGVVAGESIESFRMRPGRRAALALLDATVRHNRALSATSTTAVGLAQLTDSCRALSSPGSRVIVISDFADYSDRDGTALVALGASRDLSLLAIADPFEQTLPVRGRVAVSDGRERAAIRLSGALRTAVANERGARLAQLSRDAVRAGAMLRRIGTDDAPATRRTR